MNADVRLGYRDYAGHADRVEPVKDVTDDGRACFVRSPGDHLADVVEVVKQVGVAVLQVENQMSTEGVQSPFSEKGSGPAGAAGWNYTSTLTTGTAREECWRLPGVSRDVSH